MTQATVSNQVEITKRLWGDKVEDPMYKRSQLWNQMPKDTKTGGEGRYVVVKNSPTSGGSADFATAIASEGPTVYKRFFVEPKKQYQTFKLAGDLIERTKGDKNALLSAVVAEADSARYSFARAFAAVLFGDAGGSRGQIDSGVTLSTANLVLRVPGSYRKFEPGMKVQFASDNGTASSPAGLRDGGATLTVVSIDKEANTLVMSAALNTISGITVNDFVFRAGDYANAMTGLLGWNPLIAPSPGESFFGVDRTVGDRERMRGLIYDSSSDTTIQQVIMRSAGLAEEMGIDISTYFLAPVDYMELALQVGGTREVFVDDNKYGMGFKSIQLSGPKGVINVVSEGEVPRGYFWGTDPKDIWFRSAGEAPMILAADGGGLLDRLENEDSYRGRLGCYGNMFRENPGNSVQGEL